MTANRLKFRRWNKESNSFDYIELENGFEQSLGFTDANDKEIFENDIVYSGEDKIVVTYGIKQVDAFELYGYNITSFYGYERDGKRLKEETFVRGNIHENPEMHPDYREPEPKNETVWTLMYTDDKTACILGVWNDQKVAARETAKAIEANRLFDKLEVTSNDFMIVHTSGNKAWSLIASETNPIRQVEEYLINQ